MTQGEAKEEEEGLSEHTGRLTITSFGEREEGRERERERKLVL